MLNEFETKVKNFCEHHGMLSCKKVLVALSGGGDSVALLHVLKKISAEENFLVEAAHLNHSLRGSESDDDEKFCMKLCSELEVPLKTSSLEKDVLKKTGISLETSARECRLSFLEKTAKDIKADKIATGHNLDDQVETVLQRIMRGTGPSGLSGILPVREGVWIRPLIKMGREEIREYLINQKIGYREDSTNSELDFTRNKIRHSLIPYIEKSYNPNIKEVISRLAELSGIQDDFIRKESEEALKRCMLYGDKYKILLDKKVFSGYHEFIRQNVIRLCLSNLEGKGRNTDLDEIKYIMRLMEFQRAEADVTASVKFGVEKEIASFSLTFIDPEPVEVDLKGTTAIPLSGGIINVLTGQDNLVNGRETIGINQELIEKYGSLKVGYPFPGETIQPFGSNRQIKVKDILAEASLPKTVRKYIPVMRAGAITLWILGFRASEILRFDNKTNKNKILLNFTEGIINKRI